MRLIQHRLSFFYSGQSGNPYSVVYNSGGNPFGNAANANLPYIPKNQSDIRLVDKGTYTAAQQWNDLNQLISNDKYLNQEEDSMQNEMRCTHPGTMIWMQN